MWENRSRHHEEIHYRPWEDFYPQKWNEKKKSFQTNPSVLLLCDLEVGSKVRLQQLCTHDQLHIFCNRWHETAFLWQKDQIKMHVPAVPFFGDFTKMTLNWIIKFVLVLFGFLLCFLISHFPATVARAH